MKNNRYYKWLAATSVATILFGASACTDLDAEVFDQAEASRFPSSESELLSTVGSAYGELRGFINDPFLLSETTTDEMVVPTRGPDWFDNGAWQQLAKHEWNAVSPGQTNGAWNWCYSVIANANINLAAVSESPLQVQGKEAILAELRMLRAFGHFWAMDLFGRVPIITNDTPAGNLAQSTRTEVFNFVESEIKAALPDLRDEKGQQIYGRFTKGAANALLAKLYLNAQVYTGTARWQDALTAAEAVINSPAGYGLNPNFLQNFSVLNGSTAATYAENIFAVPYDKVLAPGQVQHFRTLHYAQGVVYGLPGNPWNGFATRAEFYNTFADGDQRKGMWLVGPQRDNAGNVITFTDGVDNQVKQLIFTPQISALERALGNEGVRGVKYEVQRNNNRNDQDNDFVIFRLADVLLMKAEAMLRMGNAGGAVTEVNKVRQRAGLTPPLTSIDLDGLLAERGRELAWEGWRRNDLIRFGKWNSTWQFKTNTQPHRVLFPIPAQQMSNNPLLTQNPGY